MKLTDDVIKGVGIDSEFMWGEDFPNVEVDGLDYWVGEQFGRDLEKDYPNSWFESYVNFKGNTCSSIDFYFMNNEGQTGYQEEEHFGYKLTDSEGKKLYKQLTEKDDYREGLVEYLNSFKSERR